MRSRSRARSSWLIGRFRIAVISFGCMVVAPLSVSSRPVRPLLPLGRSRPSVLDIYGALISGYGPPAPTRGQTGHLRLACACSLAVSRSSPVIDGAICRSRGTGLRGVLADTTTHRACRCTDPERIDSLQRRSHATSHTLLAASLTTCRAGIHGAML